MGVDYDSKLIIGWSLDTEKLKAWIGDKNLCTCEKEADGITPKKDRQGNPKVCMSTECWEEDKCLCPGLTFEYAGNMYADDIEYYLVLKSNKGSFTIQEMNELFESCKDAISFGTKLAKELSYNGTTEEEPQIFSAKYIW